MSDPLRDGLKTLIAQWREANKRSASGYYAMGYDEGQIACADELDALLVSSPQAEGWQERIQELSRRANSLEGTGGRLLGNQHMGFRALANDLSAFANQVPLPAPPVSSSPEPTKETA